MALPESPPLVDAPPPPPPARAHRRRDELLAIFALAAGLVIAATSWFLLKEFALLLRPLVLAVFLAYLVVPIHNWLRARVSARASAVLILGGTLVVVWGLAMAVYGGIVELNADLPRLIARARQVVAEVRAYGRAHLPAGLLGADEALAAAESQGWGSVRGYLMSMASGGAAMLTEALAVGVYLIFLLLDLRRFPRRIRAGFDPERAEAVLKVIARINAATMHYLRAKTLASVATGIPSAIILWAFGVRHPVLWGVLIFVGNFVPYVGSLVAVAFPVLIAFLELEPIWRPCTVMGLLVAVQTVVGYAVEPVLMGRAVDLSPLATLLCLTFWGLCWGMTGMLLAVPLTAMLKIIWENTAYTRPLAALLAEGDG